VHFNQVSISYIIKKDEGKSTDLIAPGSTVTSAAAIPVEIVKVLESTILTVPPSTCFGCTFENGKTKG
jgi:hypothetical protein